MFLSSLSSFTSIAVMVLGLCLLITIHELGHWFVARLFGFKTPVFSIGFGPRKWSIVLGKFWDTEFRLAPILAGGYVSIPELQDETTAQELLKDDPNAAKDLKVFPVWQRICVAAAGVVFNVVSAVIMLFALFAFVGEPQFEGQTKGKLGNAEMKTAVESVANELLSQYLEEHPGEAKEMVNKCLLAARARLAARAAGGLSRAGAVCPARSHRCGAGAADDERHACRAVETAGRGA